MGLMMKMKMFSIGERIENMSNKSKEKKKIIVRIEDHWFDLTDYASQHPGGETILRKYHGKDATDAFNDVKGHSDAIHLLEELEIPGPPPGLRT